MPRDALSLFIAGMLILVALIAIALAWRL